MSANDIKEVNPADTNLLVKTTLTVLVGFPFPALSYDFIDIYKTYAGGRNEIVRPSVLLSSKLMVQLSNHIDVGVTLDNFRTSFKDNYSDFVIINDKITVREFSESLNSSHLPLNLALQYTNVKTSYTTYAGFGLGLTFTSISWNESVSSIFMNDRRRGGELFNEHLISPTIKAFVGTMLDFDKKVENEFLGAFHIEVSFNYLFEKADFFTKLAQQTNNKNSVLQDRYSYLPFVFSLSAGISFNMYPEIKNKNKKQ